MLQIDTPENRRDPGMYTMGLIHSIVFNFFSFMVLVCLILAIVTPPGSVPDTAEWIYVENDKRDQPVEIQTALETKKTGERRFCKWKCGKYKPDRTHHCRVCDSCILRMDHHCPWIYNCVGFRNHKYFFLLLFYTALATVFVTCTMPWSVIDVISKDEPSMSELFLVMFGETLTLFLALIVTGFFGFHVFLAIKGLTTIEFCEKQKDSENYDSMFSKGVYGNFQEILGKSPLIWLLPIHPGHGDGLSFDVDLSKFDHSDRAEKGKSLVKDEEPSIIPGDDGGTGGGVGATENAPLLG